MSKILTIMRHAKSSWEDISSTDAERPVIPKGIKRTKKSCDFLNKTQLIPDQIWVSPAKRAIQTGQIVMEKLKIDSLYVSVPDFYGGSIEKMIMQIKKCHNQFSHLLIIGHNPDFTEMACSLARKTISEWIPTSGMVTLKFHTDKWADILKADVEVLHIAKPKEL
jgi:phosphohistidine phosphatase